MASPVSIGDALLIGRLAYQLGCAFTSGRKSAPKEFREIENQLYSLSTALRLLNNGRAVDTDGYALNLDLSSAPRLQINGDYHNDDILGLMIQNCQETLKHLESIVEKYSVIRDPPKEDLGARKPLAMKWKRELRENWRKIMWTTEGGDLGTLRSQLTVHTNSLNLVVGIINKYFFSLFLVEYAFHPI